MKYVIVSGSRRATSKHAQLIETALRGEHPDVVIHGACQGVDNYAGAWAKRMAGCSELPVPANWDKDGKSAGPGRNRALVAIAAELHDLGWEVKFLAFPCERSRGTKNFIKEVRDMSFEDQLTVITLEG